MNIKYKSKHNNFGWIEMTNMKKANKTKVTCRPCKEENNWEIEAPNGKVLSKHYNTKSECVKAGRQYAAECGATLYIEDYDKK